MKIKNKPTYLILDNPTIFLTVYFTIKISEYDRLRIRFVHQDFKSLENSTFLEVIISQIYNTQLTLTFKENVNNIR